MSRHLSRLQAVVLGLIVLGGLGLGVFGLFAIGSRNGLDGSAFTVHAGFADIAGVEVGTRVRVQGIDAGEVEAILPPAAAGEQVRLRLRVAGRLRHLVGDDARVQIASESLLGGKIVRILPGAANAAAVEEGAQLASLSTPDLADGLAQATGKLNRVLTEIDTALAEFRAGQGTTGTITRELAQATAKLNTVLSKVDATIDGVQRGEGTLGQLVKNDGLYRELNDTLGQVKGALYEIRSGEGTLGKLVKSNDVYAEALMSLQDVRKMVASVKQNADAIKSLPVVRSYVVDAHKELVRPECRWYRKWFLEKHLFEPGGAALTEDGKKLLDGIADWVNEDKASDHDVVIAAFAAPGQDAEYARTVTQKQAEAVCEYLRSNHRVHRTGFWYWSNRNVRPLGVGTNPPSIPGNEKLPAARIEVNVFLPRAS